MLFGRFVGGRVYFIRRVGRVSAVTEAGLIFLYKEKIGYACVYEEDDDLVWHGQCDDN